jgi:type IV secretory pathway VirB4 component
VRAPRLPAHETTTAQLGAAYPLAADAGLGAPGVLIGRDLLGGAFVFDPFELYARGLLTSPNLLVFGQIGRGKSAFVKSWLWRQAAFGRRAFVIDPKGEYGTLARALGATPVTLRPGGALRVNPLDAGEAGRGAPDELARRRLELLAALATACLGRRLAPAEHAALELALDLATRRTVGRQAQPTLSEVVAALLAPTSDDARRIGSSQAVLRADGRDVGLELRRLVSGDLRGIFDGQTTPGLDPTGEVVVLDLSALYHSPALGVVMTCAAAWLQAGLRAGSGARTVLVVDEAWAVLADRGVARWLQSTWKLSRALGVSNVAVLHRVSDLQGAGAAGSEESRLAEGLLADSETRVLFGQPNAELAAARQLLGISRTEESLLGGLRRGVALWKVGGRSFLVEHLLAPAERRIVDTDERMAAVGR